MLTATLNLLVFQEPCSDDDDSDAGISDIREYLIHPSAVDLEDDEHQTLAEGRERCMSTGGHDASVGQQNVFSVETQLENMFPQLPKEVVLNALRISSSLQDAIDSLLVRNDQGKMTTKLCSLKHVWVHLYTEGMTDKII